MESEDESVDEPSLDLLVSDEDDDDEDNFLNKKNYTYRTQRYNLKR